MRRTWGVRPNGNYRGLWVELTLHNGDVYHGLLDNDLLHLDLPRAGFLLRLPMQDRNAKKFHKFPLRDVKVATVLGVIGSLATNAERARMHL